MKMNIKERLMLYALGRYYEESSKTVSEQTLTIQLPKRVFIDFVKQVQLFEKGERAIYKNLEYLEKRKLVSYENKSLKLTERGQNLYKKIKEEIKPYFQMNKIIVDDRVKKSKKLQTTFRIVK